MYCTNYSPGGQIVWWRGHNLVNLGQSLVFFQVESVQDVAMDLPWICWVHIDVLWVFHAVRCSGEKKCAIALSIDQDMKA